MAKEAGSKIIKAIQEATGSSEEDVKAMLSLCNGDANAATAALIESPFQSVSTNKTKKEKPAASRDAPRSGDRMMSGRGRDGGPGRGGSGRGGSGAPYGRGAYSGSGRGTAPYGGRGRGDSRSAGPYGKPSYASGDNGNFGALPSLAPAPAPTPSAASASNLTGWDAPSNSVSDPASAAGGVEWDDGSAADVTTTAAAPAWGAGAAAGSAWGAGGGKTGGKKTLAEILKEKQKAPPPAAAPAPAPAPEPLEEPASADPAEAFAQDQVYEASPSGVVDWDAPAESYQETSHDEETLGPSDNAVSAPAASGSYAGYSGETKAAPKTGAEVDALQLSFGTFGLGDFGTSFGAGYKSELTDAASQPAASQPVAPAPPAPAEGYKPTNYGTYVLNSNGDKVTPAAAPVAVTQAQAQPTAQVPAVQPASQPQQSQAATAQPQQPGASSNYSTFPGQNASNTAAFSNFSSTGFGAVQPSSQQQTQQTQQVQQPQAQQPQQQQAQQQESSNQSATGTASYTAADSFSSYSQDTLKQSGGYGSYSNPQSSSSLYTAPAQQSAAPGMNASSYNPASAKYSSSYNQPGQNQQAASAQAPASQQGHQAGQQSAHQHGQGQGHATQGHTHGQGQAQGPGQAQGQGQVQGQGQQYGQGGQQGQPGSDPAGNVASQPGQAPHVPSTVLPQMAQYGGLHTGMPPGMQYGSYGAMSHMPAYPPQFGAAMNPAMYQMYNYAYPTYQGMPQGGGGVFAPQPGSSYPVAPGGGSNPYGSGSGGRSGNYSSYNNNPAGSMGAGGISGSSGQAGSGTSAYGANNSAGYGLMGAGGAGGVGGYDDGSASAPGGNFNLPKKQDDSAMYNAMGMPQSGGGYQNHGRGGGYGGGGYGGGGGMPQNPYGNPSQYNQLPKGGYGGGNYGGNRGLYNQQQYGAPPGQYNKGGL